MFCAMRRRRQILPPEECAAVRSRGTSGVLALCGCEGTPYAVPLSYVYDGGNLYFHCAKSGYKLDIIRQNPRASFCVIDQDRIVPEEYTTYFRSVIAFGQIRVIEDDREKRTAIEKLAIKYAPEDTAANRDHAISREWKLLCLLEMAIDHMTGKEAAELIKEKQKDT